MEVHHHPDLHHKTKKWKEYFLEFLMIFLAVTLGFLAESLREDITENKREKEYMKSLLKDLGDDMRSVSTDITEFSGRRARFDSLIFLLQNKTERSNTNALYYLARTATRPVIFFNNTTTIDQMKNSGGFRFVRNTQVASKILFYYGIVPSLRNLENNEFSELEEFRKLAVYLFDPSVFNEMLDTNGVINRPANNPVLLSDDRSLLVALAAWTHYMKGAEYTIHVRKKEIFRKGTELMNMIRKEYEINDE